MLLIRNLTSRSIGLNDAIIIDPESSVKVDTDITNNFLRLEKLGFISIKKLHNTETEIPSARKRRTSRK